MTKIESKDYYVLSEDKETYRCTLRGKFKKEYALKKDKLFATDIASVGDYVEFDLNPDGTGVIHIINERFNYLSRKAPKLKGSSHRGERLEQIIAVNIDQVIVVSSVHNPDFNNRTVDRFLVGAESAHLDSQIIINKSDLMADDEIIFWKDLYEKIGYKVLITSAVTNEGLNEVKEILSKKKSLFWGQSGVGKSSILNILYPHLNLKIGKISKYDGKGTHTTVTSSMIQVEDNTFIIDTPGLREIDPYGIKKEDLGHYFVDFTDYLKECRFNTCTHYHEPDCGVISAVENGNIDEFRYDSYLRLLDTIEEDIIF
ncbi:MAG: ribosome small subunit-dependent GTPase A [Ignavibacterium sp.]|nr:MAG: ribosome small subunit-dependent GTPase A [Ignavibacterium sp.]